MQLRQWKLEFLNLEKSDSLFAVDMEECLAETSWIKAQICGRYSTQ